MTRSLHGVVHAFGCPLYTSLVDAHFLRHIFAWKNALDSILGLYQ